MKTQSTEKKKSGIGGLLAKLVLAALLIYASVTLYGLQDQIRTANAEKAQLTDQVQKMTDGNEALRSDIASVGDSEKMEQAARDNHGMVKPGEKVFYP